MTTDQVNSVVSSISEARQRGQDVWDLFLRGFGSGPTTPSLVFPTTGVPSFPTIYGIGIGPRSHVDRCWILWDPVATVSLPDAETGIGQASDFIRRVSVTTPLLFTQAGNQSTTFITTSNIGGIRVAPSPEDFYPPATSVFKTDDDFVFRPDAYRPVGAGVDTPIVWNDFTQLNSPNWSPVLHLQFYLRPPLDVPTARVPFAANSNSLAGVVGTEALLGIFPVFGRKRVRVRVIGAAGSATAGTIRVGGWGSPQLIPIMEQTIGTAAYVSSQGTLVVDPVLHDFMTVYLNPSAGTGFVTASVFAVDY